MTDTGGPDLPRGIALAWGIAAEPQRGPKREMSVERIVDAAVELADAEGLGAVSMAAVAAKLGYTPMSLYRYVSAKDDLILLMQESATGMPPAIDAEGWRDRVVAYHDALMTRYLRHPWMVEIRVTGVTATPVTASWMDAGIQLFDGTPLGDDARLALALQLTGYAHWNATVMIGMMSRATDTGRGFDESHAEDDQLLARLVTADEFPSLHRAISSGVMSNGSDPFRFGLGRIVDGIAAYVDALAAGTVLPAPPEPFVEAPAVLADKKYKEAHKKVREAEKLLRAAHREERASLREARERLRQQQAKDRGQA